MLTREKLIEALENELGVDTSDVGDDTPLFSSGLVDSFSLVSLIVFIETAGRFTVEPAEVNLENFDTITRILSFARRRAESLAVPPRA